MVRPQTASTIGTPCARAAPGHTDRRLAAQALAVEAAFAGDHHVGAGQSLVQTDQVQDDVDAGPRLGAEHRQGGVADTAGGAGALGLGVPLRRLGADRVRRADPT